jgi:hypothetical protein
MTKEFDPNIDYTATNDSSHASPHIALRNGCEVNVSKKLATAIIMHRITVTRLEEVRYLQLKHIGLGVYAVKLLPAHMRENKLLTSFY